MKNLLALIVLVSVLKATAQDKPVTSESLTISGKIKKEMTHLLSNLDTFKKADIGNMDFLDAKEMKYKAMDIKGILLKDLLGKIEFQPETHKAINKFYLVFEAPDGFKVVFSYNEIFHPQGSANLYLVTDYDGKDIKNMDERILIISCNDLKTGHKFIKGLDKIIVKEAE
jgi:hypothetical protein